MGTADGETATPSNPRGATPPNVLLTLQCLEAGPLRNRNHWTCSKRGNGEGFEAQSQLQSPGRVLWKPAWESSESSYTHGAPALAQFLGPGRKAPGTLP